ncbi:MAG TPA: hypothetical protein VMB03_12240 [Bryobacteraceae bacterium]|nr:hypothetical protein [Bryobacteraceae bacterium]
MARKKRQAKTPPALGPAETPVPKAAGKEKPWIEESGDLQGLSDIPDEASESVRELAAEGQYFEAAVISGVENAPEPEAGPIRTHERKVDDVPPEYTEHPPDEPKE